LKRAIQRDIVNPLSQAILKGEIKDGSHVEVDFREGTFTFSPQPVSV
jgi:ATP-dependent Clp protease ATP-binding subunit ClpA